MIRIRMPSFPRVRVSNQHVVSKKRVTLQTNKLSFHTSRFTRQENKKENENNQNTHNEEQKLHNLPPGFFPHREQTLNPPVPLRWRSALFLLVFGAVFAAIFQYMKQQKEEEIKQKMNRTIGKAKVGGPFTLVDHTGKPVTDLDFMGRFMFIYFGFTNCPDICPTELTKLSKVLNNLENKGIGLNYIQPVFISVDPMRDTVGQVRSYVKEFHPNLLGLTGTPDQVAQVCKSYRVYYSKAFDHTEENDDYLVDHSIILYLMDPKGEFCSFFGNNLNEQEITEKVLDLMYPWLDPDTASIVKPPLWKKLLRLA